MKLTAITIASLFAVAVNAADIYLCNDAYFKECSWRYNVVNGECLNAAPDPRFNWTGFDDENVSSYRQANSGSCGKCYYFADPDCHNQMFNGGDYEIGWLGDAGNNDKLSSIFCTQGA